jgi:hypothetical protein
MILGGYLLDTRNVSQEKKNMKLFENVYKLQLCFYRTCCLFTLDNVFFKYIKKPM